MTTTDTHQPIPADPAARSWRMTGAEIREVLARHPIALGASAAVSAGLLLWRIGPHLQLAAYLVTLAVAGPVLALVDLDQHRIPDLILGPATAATAVLLACTGTTSRLITSTAAALAVTVLHGIVAWTRPHLIGLGDVKLTVLLVLLLAWAGPPAITVFAATVFAIGVGVRLLRPALRQIPLATAALPALLLAVVLAPPAP